MDILYIVMAGVGGLFGLGALVLVWAYLVDTIRGVRMPEYKDIRLVVNVLFALALALLSFLSYRHFDWNGLFTQVFILHGLCWVLTFLVSLVALIVKSDKDGLGSGVLTAMWKILIVLVAFFAMPR